MEKWNKNDWQGRSQENVEGTYKNMGFAMFVLAGFFMGWAIFQTVSYFING